MRVTNKQSVACLLLSCLVVFLVGLSQNVEAQKASSGEQTPSTGQSPTEVETKEVVSGPVEDLIESGNHLVNHQRYDEAITAYKEAQEKAGKPVYTIWLDLGYAYLQKQDYPNATNCFGQALGMRPNDPNAHLGAAEAAYDSAKYPEAEKQYRQVIQLSRGGINSQAHHFLGTTLYQEHHLDEAIAEFKTAIAQANGPYGEAHYDLGVAYMDQGKNADAEREFRTAIDQDRGLNGDDYFNLGVILEREKRPKEAAAAYEKYLGLTPDAKDQEKLRQRIANLKRQ